MCINVLGDFCNVNESDLFSLKLKLYFKGTTSLYLLFSMKVVVASE